MPKIKNWSKTNDERWDHDNKKLMLTVFSYERAPNDTRYSYIIKRPGTRVSFSPYKHEDFKKKDKAMKRARKWMRNNPNPNYDALRRKYN